MSQSSASGQENSGVPPLLPVAAIGNELPFLFVSYARVDLERLKPVLDYLKASGVALWADNEIILGEEWDARLQQELVACSGVLAFVTREYVNSKYCRREIKFADTLNKPIFAACFPEAILADGLAFLEPA
jgi:hypothetical protein